MNNTLHVEQFMEKRRSFPVIDVRTPDEYDRGHVPGAVNVPLFSNDERAEIGTLYKQQGREQAVLRGLELAGPKLAGYVRKGRDAAVDNTVLVHCWRGGMRSASVAWLLQTAGLNAYTLAGGYKAYRHYVREQFSCPARLVVIGGMTGSGKTDILYALKGLGEQVLDLEGLASHKGSGFGFINMGEQPTNEQFENNSYEIWQDFDPALPVWIEDESRKIGKVVINDPLYEQMRRAPLIRLELAKEHRIRRLEREYCTVQPGVLIGVIHKIEKRLGPQRTKQVLEYIENSDFYNAIDVVLDYYDRSYRYGISKRDRGTVHEIILLKDEPGSAAKKILTLNADLPE